MERPKYNKFITAGCWLFFAIVSACIILLQPNIQVAFFWMLIAQFITFFATANGPAGEKIFLFLAYANSFCIVIGARLYLIAFCGMSAYISVCGALIIAVMHMLMNNSLLPIYRKAKIFFQSGWLQINLILTLFLIQFINRYAFGVIDKNSAQITVLDFVIYSILFYSTLFFIFAAVKDAAESNKKTYENYELKSMAYIDELTKLQNRTAYIKFTKKQTLKNRKSRIGSFICVVMDIDGFKSINDIKGHAEGDRILQETGAFMQENFRSFNYSIFRIGGDEFVLIAEDVKLSEIIIKMDNMNEKMLETIGTTMSYGWSEIAFSTAKPFDEAFEKADEMMYENKQKKKEKV